MATGFEYCPACEREDWEDDEACCVFCGYDALEDSYIAGEYSDDELDDVCDECGANICECPGRD